MNPFVTSILKKAYDLATKRGLQPEGVDLEKSHMPQVVLAFDYPVSDEDFENMPITVSLLGLHLDRGFKNSSDIAKILARPEMYPTIHLKEMNSSDWSHLIGKNANYFFFLKNFEAPEAPFTFNKDFINLHFLGLGWENKGQSIDMKNFLGLKYVNLYFADSKTLNAPLSTPDSPQINLYGPGWRRETSGSFPKQKLHIPASLLILRDTNAHLQLFGVEIEKEEGVVFNWVEAVNLGVVTSIPDSINLGRMFPLADGFSMTPSMDLKEVISLLKKASPLRSVFLDLDETDFSKDDMELLLKSKGELKHLSMMKHFPGFEILTLDSKRGWMKYNER